MNRRTFERTGNEWQASQTGLSHDTGRSVWFSCSATREIILGQVSPVGVAALSDAQLVEALEIAFVTGSSKTITPGGRKCAVGDLVRLNDKAPHSDYAGEIAVVTDYTQATHEYVLELPEGEKQRTGVLSADRLDRVDQFEDIASERLLVRSLWPDGTSVEVRQRLFATSVVKLSFPEVPIPPRRITVAMQAANGGERFDFILHLAVASIRNRQRFEGQVRSGIEMVLDGEAGPYL